MHLVADLHIHSRYSRATSQDLDFPSLHRSALSKGVQIVGTGDFTHPGWMKQIEEQLVPAEDGLFRLEDSLARKAEEGLPPACQGAAVRFVLEVELSNIYEHAGRVRKNHNLVFVPSLDAAKRFTTKLEAIGNVRSDGRPILGLDARDLLEITLETDPLAFLVPAHIWTPWFSMLGSMSGFDSLDACFRDLASHVFAAETGLSSDPAMNWRVSSLDRITLLSNSDAHSPAKLAREANLFDIDRDYPSMRRAIETRKGFLGTLEFFPEEGKYHLDGHRKCGVRLDPEQTRALDGQCPVCGGKLTVGVMSRVIDLADRPSGVRPEGASPFRSLVSLAQVAGEALGVGGESRKAQAIVAKLLSEIGPELEVLRHAPIEDIDKKGGGVVAEAVRRVRAGELSIAAGYDGEFGTVSIFSPEERARVAGQTTLIASDSAPPKPARKRAKTKKSEGGNDRALAPVKAPELSLTAPNDPLAGLDPDQLRVATQVQGPVLVVAGPGTGKTRALAARIAHQVLSGACPPDQALALTFTNQAAAELRSRIDAILPKELSGRVEATTFHGFGRQLLRAHATGAFELLDDDQRLAVASAAIGPHAKQRDAEALVERISLAKQTVDPESALKNDAQVVGPWKRYEALLAEKHAVDVDDLVLRAYRSLQGDPALAHATAERLRSVCVDEYQDVNDVQAALVRLLSPDGSTLCAIGDPDQAIYAFRGARPEHFLRFEQTYPSTSVVTLGTTYRLTRQVLAAARSVLDKGAKGEARVRSKLESHRDGPKVEVVASPSPSAEAEQILVRLEKIVGGTSLFAVDSGRGGEAEYSDVGFGDVAVLVRTKAQRAEILEALGRSGVPCHAVGEDEPHDPRSQKVAVMTMHAAKGREFAVVFVTGVEPGLMPLEIEGLETDPREERRLLYVAITRAKRLAVLSHCARRVLFGRALAGGPSTFLKSMPANAVDRMVARPPAKTGAGQLSLF